MSRRTDDADEAFAAFANARAGEVYRTAYLLVSNPHDAEDLAQLALGRALVAWRRHGRLENPDGYVYRIMVNARTAIWRRGTASQELLTGWLPERDVPSAETGIVETDLLLRALNNLPPQQRTAVVLRYYVDLSIEDTAKSMGCSVGTVKAYASRGLSTLRIALGETDGDVGPSSQTGLRA